ncbi:MAG: hypothetical protein ACFFFY_03275 [Promethearchaeota archaeon]
MRKKIILFLSGTIIGVCLLLASGNAKAHSPINMSLNYDLNTHILEVSITHPVSDPYTHFIYMLDISVNNVTETHYEIYQPNPNRFSYYYPLSANLGDLIEVTAYCTDGGSITRFLIVEEPTIPGYFGTYFIIGFTIILLLSFVRKKIEKVAK